MGGVAAILARSNHLLHAIELYLVVPRLAYIHIEEKKFKSHGIFFVCLVQCGWGMNLFKGAFT